MTLLPEERPIKSPDNLAAFASHFRFCWACGLSEFEPEASWSRRLQIHHIVKLGRSDEGCNLCRLCLLCHQLAEHEQVRGNDGHLLPYLELEHVLYLKALHDRRRYNRKRLETLRHRRLPVAMMPPKYFQREYIRRRKLRAYPTLKAAK